MSPRGNGRSVMDRRGGRRAGMQLEVKEKVETQRHGGDGGKGAGRVEGGWRETCSLVLHLPSPPTCLVPSDGMERAGAPLNPAPCWAQGAVRGHCHLASAGQGPRRGLERSPLTCGPVPVNRGTRLEAGALGVCLDLLLFVTGLSTSLCGWWRGPSGSEGS